MSRNQVLVSVTVPELGMAGEHHFEVELDLNWEDYEILSGKTALTDVLDAADVDYEQVKSVHLPPGTRTRGRDIGMAATEENIGAFTDFVYQQIEPLADPFLVMHPDKTLSYTEQLPLLATMNDLAHHDISIENTKGAQYWRTPEDMAFYAYAAEARDEIDRLHLTVDSAHFIGAQSPELVDQAALDRIQEEVSEYPDIVADYSSFLSNQLTVHEDVIEQYNVPEEDPYRPLLRTLMLAGDRVRSVHLNDPVTNDLPKFTSRQQEPGLYAAIDLMEEHDIYAVLKPDNLVDDPYTLRKQADTVRSVYADAA